MTRSRQMNLCLFLQPAGNHGGGWRMPGSRSSELATFNVARDMVLQAESAKMDAIFIADTIGHGRTSLRRPITHRLEPLTTLAALSTITSKIGLIATASTTFNPPYTLARYFSSIDHLSLGRAGWNIVTSVTGNENYGTELLPHDERYAQAHEYMDVVTRLWDSWEEDTIVDDAASGTWSVPEKIHALNFKGKHYTVAGALTSARSPQGRPVFVQAGASDAGMDFAATYAEVIFTQQSDMTAAQKFYKDIKERVARKGRDPEQVKVLPGLMPIIADTEAAAIALADRLADLVERDVATKALKIQMNDIALDDLDLDQPIPVDRLVHPSLVQGSVSKYTNFYNLAHRDRLPLRQLLRMASTSGGHLVKVGTAEQVADTMQEWFSQRACDGFNLVPAYLMNGLNTMTYQLIPLLQRRGEFRTEYEGKSLRDHLGLDIPKRREI